MSESISPNSVEELAAVLRDATAASHQVRIVGAGTKLAWLELGRHGAPPLMLRTAGLSTPIEHHPGDRLAVIAAGVPLAQARSELAVAGQLLALDPPLGLSGRQEATLGGVIASADTGPLSHRYGGVREQLVGLDVALADGTIVRTGRQVARSAAGYDLMSLYAGSFGALGVILAACVRLHPLPEATATALGTSSDPSKLVLAARQLTAVLPDLQALDLAWRGGRGGLLAQADGAQPHTGAARAARAMREGGLEAVDVIDDDRELWARQRSGQRSADLALVRVAIEPSQLPRVLTLADAQGATVIARAALGIAYVELEPERLPGLLAGLPSRVRASVLDLPVGAVLAEGRWHGTSPGSLELMRSVKSALDPAWTCNPGSFVTGL